MLTKKKLQKFEGILKSFDLKSGHATRRNNMEKEEENNYLKLFYTMVEKVEKLFAENEKTIKPRRKEPDDHDLINHGAGGENPPPSPYSSDSSYSSSSHHYNKHHMNASKKPFLS